MLTREGAIPEASIGIQGQLSAGDSLGTAGGGPKGECQGGQGACRSHGFESLFGLLRLYKSDTCAFLDGVALDRFQRVALLTTITTYLLIAVGGLVRASGAGLGCPDWPQCFGLWIPPLSAEGLPAGWDRASFNVFKTWTEYINRLLGVVTGLLILATLVLAVLDHRRSPRVLVATTAAFVLVIFNGWLGGIVVKSGLAPLILTGHLVFALLVVSCLLYATMQAFFPPGEVPTRGSRPEMGVATLVVLAGVLAQVGVGAFLRGEVQEIAAAGVPRAEWLVLFIENRVAQAGAGLQPKLHAGQKNR